jgi:ligand-binding sensor domain-containing protein
VRDKQGNKWIGTDNGLVKYNGVNFTVLPSGFTTYYESISSLAIENDSVVLVGTGWGLSRFDGKGWAQFRIGNSGLPSDNIWDLYKDSLGITWIGTNSGGLAKVEGTEWTVYNTANSGMPVNDVISVAADKNHTVWIGTWNGGLASFSGEKWTIWNTSNSPLPSNIVYSVEIDHYGNKWIGTSAGLAIFNEDGIKGRNNLPENDIANTSSSIGRIYPNPVNGSAVVPVKIGSKGWVTLKLMTVCGQELLVLNDKKLHAGEHSFMLDSTGLAKGLYLCVLTTADGIIAERFIIN